MSERWFRRLLVTMGDADGEEIDGGTRERTRSELSTGDTPFFSKQISAEMTVPTGSVSTPVPLGPVTNGKAISLVYNKAISISVNGGTAIQLSIPTDVSDDDRGVFHLEGAFTTVALVNAGAANATVLYAVVGT